jgi:NADH-quinone oxidoreductase subunit A
MLLFFILFVPLFVLILLGVHMLVATSNPDPAKIAPYECGFSSFSDARQKFQISFFLVAILFLVFDSEILFLYPLVVSLYHVSFLGFWIALFFIVIITIGFIYELASNVLDYAKTPSSKNTPLGPLASQAGGSVQWINMVVITNIITTIFLRGLEEWSYSDVINTKRLNVRELRSNAI